MSGRTAEGETDSALVHASHDMWTTVIDGASSHQQDARRLVSARIDIPDVMNDADTAIFNPVLLRHFVDTPGRYHHPA
jgi:hypothetical protein